MVLSRGGMSMKPERDQRSYSAAGWGVRFHAGGVNQVPCRWGQSGSRQVGSQVPCRWGESGSRQVGPQVPCRGGMHCPGPSRFQSGGVTGAIQGGQAGPMRGGSMRFKAVRVSKFLCVWGIECDMQDG